MGHLEEVGVKTAQHRMWFFHQGGDGFQQHRINHGLTTRLFPKAPYLVLDHRDACRKVSDDGALFLKTLFVI